MSDLKIDKYDSNDPIANKGLEAKALCLAEFGIGYTTVIKQFMEVLKKLREQYRLDNKGKRISYAKLADQYQLKDEEQNAELAEAAHGDGEAPGYTTDQWNMLMRAAAYELATKHTRGK